MALTKVRLGGIEPQYVGKRNLIINGAMQVAQRGTSTSGVGASTPVFPCVDRFRFVVGGTTAGRATVSQSTDAPNGFANSLKIDVTTADTSIASTEALFLNTLLEGQDLQQIKKGTSDAESLTLSFYVKGNASATYTCEIRDLDNDRINTQTFSVTTSWNRITLTFIPDTTGALDNNNGASLQISFILHAGSTYTSGTFASNTWAARVQGNRVSSSGTSIFDSTDRELFITGVQLEVGSVATPFEHRSFGEELGLCQRYLNIFGKAETGNNYENFGTVVAFGTNAGEHRMQMTMPTTMRAIPSVGNSGNFACLGQVDGGGVLSSIGLADGGSKTIIGLNLTMNAGNDRGDVSPFRSNNDADAFISFDAEL